MKTALRIALALLLFSCNEKPGSQEEEKKAGPDTFTLTKTDIALIYENKLEGIPCLLHNVTDTLKNDKRAGIIFRFDVSYDHPRQSDCCALEPGTEGTNTKLKSVKISLKKDVSETEITDQLLNTEQSQMRNSFENYIQGKFDAKDYICVCKGGPQGRYMEHINRRHLKRAFDQSMDSSEVQVLKDVKAFTAWYNRFAGEAYSGPFHEADSGWKLTLYYFYFWMPEDIKAKARNYDTLQILIELENGRVLKGERKIIHEA